MVFRAHAMQHYMYIVLSKKCETQHEHKVYYNMIQNRNFFTHFYYPFDKI